MGRQVNFITPIHKKTKRDYIHRMTDGKVEAMETAGKYGKDYWDGDRRYGYGGYRYDGRWERVARAMIRKYRLGKRAKILDAGCGKGYLLYEFQKLLPDAFITGFDISIYAVKHAKSEIKENLFVHKIQNKFPFTNMQFDLVISINVLHNLHIPDLSNAISEIERTGRKKYISVESYRNEKELFNLECWALTCRSFYNRDDWIWLFKHFRYSGDYEFIYFE